MVHSYRQNGGMRYGPGSPRQRHNDRGSPSSNPASSSEPESPGHALRHQPEDRRQVEEAGRPSPIVPTGPKSPHSTVLSLEEEAIIVAFRRHTLLPLDDCLYALQPTIPHLTRSSLHRCLQRHGISRLARDRRRQAGQEEVQGLPDRLLPYRHRRGAHRGRASSTCSSPSTAPASSPSSNCTRRPHGGSRPTSCAP